MKSLRKILEKIIEGLIYFSGNITTVIILLIIFFLFKEGAGLFNRNQVEEGYILAVNPQNPLKDISAKNVRNIFEKNVTNWKEIGGHDAPIVTFSIDDLEKFFSEDQLSSFDSLPYLIAGLSEREKGLIALIPEKYALPSVHRITVEKLSVGKFLGGKEWYPAAVPSPQLGVLPIILGSIWVTLGAMLFCLPIGLAVAIYMAELSTPKIRSWLKPTIELLAGIPSVVFGFFGLIVIVPMMQYIFNLPVGETALSGSILLGIISLPTIITLSEDAMRSCPTDLRAASFALGANHWQTIYKIIIPYSKSGIISACILGIGRSIGETMAVLMVTGNSAIIPTSLLQPVRTITATIAAELGEAPQGGIHYEALFMLGCVLFLITFLMNILAEILIVKKHA